MVYQEKDVTTNPRYMRELEKLAGRFITPMVVIDGQAFIGFGRNLGPIRILLQEKGLLKE